MSHQRLQLPRGLCQVSGPKQFLQRFTFVATANVSASVVVVVVVVAGGAGAGVGGAALVTSVSSVGGNSAPRVSRCCPHSSLVVCSKPCCEPRKTPHRRAKKCQTS